jgi:hypothetical protein
MLLKWVVRKWFGRVCYGVIWFRMGAQLLDFVSR